MQAKLVNKKILVVGGSGRVGQKLVEYCLEEKAKVRSFVRNPEKLQLQDSNLELYVGDVKNSLQVEEALEGIDIVFSTLSGRSTKPDYSILSVGMRNILEAMKKQKVTRILNVGGAGILDDEVYGLRRNSPTYPSIFLPVSEENLKVLFLLKESNLDWTMVCAPEMPKGERTGIYRTKINYLPKEGRRISVEDVADFMLDICLNSNYYKTKVGIAY